MKTIESINKIHIYELNGNDSPGIDAPQLIVKNHWNRREFVIVETPSGESVTVTADALERAIQNARNAHQF